MKIGEHINIALTDAMLFAPCKFVVHFMALERPDLARPILSNLFLTKPIDTLIQALSVPVFTVIHHFRDNEKRSFGAKALYHASLIVKLIASLGASILLGINGIITWPIQPIYSVFKGNKSSEDYFVLKNEFARRFSNLINCLPSKTELTYENFLKNHDINPKEKTNQNNKKIQNLVLQLTLAVLL